jgi:hypothetical protein
VRERAEDITALQELLDASHALAGAHLRRIITRERRLSAVEVVERLTGMRLLALATVTADGRPVVGPVDGIFYRGCFHFGTAPDAVRMRHIRRRPGVSATHLPGEELAVTVHGRAVPIDVGAPEHADFRDAVLGIYVPRYGEEWEAFLDSGVVYARIDPVKMFTFRMEAGAGEGSAADLAGAEEGAAADLAGAEEGSAADLAGAEEGSAADLARTEEGSAADLARTEGSAPDADRADRG